MPSSLDQARSNPHQAGGNHSIQDGVPKTHPSGGRRGKGRRKYDEEEDDPNDGAVTNTPPGVR